MKVRTRFAPSPTGSLHIGSLRTAIYAYAFARHSQGNFLLRIEDTDKKRETEGSKDKILSILKTFGLNWDEEPVIQSERVTTGVYKRTADRLMAEGYAFYCQCQPKGKDTTYERPLLRDSCRDRNFQSGAVKLKVPDDEKIFYHDFVFRTDISWNSNAVADTILLKSDGFPTYHLAVVVDDTDMEITHVFRGYDWMPSTPIHLLVYKYLGLTPPEIGHLTDIQDPNGGKLSKRKGNVSCEQFLAAGYLPEALFNFVILVGWAPKDNRELFTLPEFITAFDPTGLQKANPIFNPVKLKWFNQHYIRALDDAALTEKIKPFSTHNLTQIQELLPLVKDRLVTLCDFDPLVDYFFVRPEPAAKDRKILAHAAAVLNKNWDGKYLEEEARKYCAANKLRVGDYFMALRIAVTGQTATPPFWDIISKLGKNETLSRF